MYFYAVRVAARARAVAAVGSVAPRMALSAEPAPRKRSYTPSFRVCRPTLRASRIQPW